MGDIFECHTVFTRAIVGRVTFKKYHMREIYARTVNVRIEKPMAVVATFLATSEQRVTFNENVAWCIK